MSVIKDSMTKYKVRLTFTDEVLGSLPGDPELHETYIASKAPDAPTKTEEIEQMGIGDMVEKGMTVFPRDDSGKVCAWDYQLRGMIKENIKNIKKHYPASECAKVKANKQTADNAIFVNPRLIPFQLPPHQVIGDCQRPLRAETAQGPRTAIAHSESIPEGSQITFEIEMTPTLGKGINGKEVLEEVLDYGALKGFGQWRNSGRGRFTWEYVE